MSLSAVLQALDLLDSATVTGHVCCDPVFNDNEVPRYVLTGDRRMVRDLFRDAELAIANHDFKSPISNIFALLGIPGRLLHLANRKL